MGILKNHIKYFLWAVILLEACIILGLCAVGGGVTLPVIDGGIMTTLTHMRSEQGNSLMLWITSLGDYRFVLHMAVVIALLTAVFGHIEVALGILVGLAGTSALSQVLKDLFHRMRPLDQVVTTSGWSYPSGHASASAILAIMIIWAAIVAIPHKLIRYTVIVCAVVYAAAVAISRLYLGVHWFSDVIGGMLLAASVGLLVMGILKPVIMKRKLNR